MLNVFSKQKRFYFISGLPRSGSTLLSSLLSQNPDMSTVISDPLFGYVTSIVNQSKDKTSKTVVSDEKIQDMSRDLFASYYKETQEKIIFNTNRVWTNHTHLLKDLFPDFKMIVCLRDIPWILDSVERLYRKNIYSVKPMVGDNCSNVYERCHLMMGNHLESSAKGFVVEPLFGVKNAIACDESDHIMFLDYDALTKHPQEVMQKIYSFLGEKEYKHDFDNVRADYTEYDESLGCEDLHTIRSKVEYKDRKPVIPYDLWNLYSQETIWKTNPQILQGKNSIIL